MSKLTEELRGLQAYIGKLLGDEDKSYQDMFSDLRDEISNRISRHEHENPSINGHGVTVCPKCAEPIAHCKDCQPFRDKPLTCSQCCGTLVSIRGRFPKDPDRTVCPTCLQEREDDRRISGPCKAEDKARAYLGGLK